MTRPLTGYVRVSQVRGRSGDSFISPKVQEDRIRQWGEARGHAVDEVLVELDQSGAKRDRPLLMEAMRRVEAGESGGIVVAKLDRFGRSLVNSLALIERIEAKGAVFASVADGFDLTTETGRLTLRIMLALAEFELDRIRGSFADGRQAAVARGLHLSAVAPTGYLQVKDDDGRLSGPLETDPQWGPAVTEAFALRASGGSWRDVGKLLEDRKVKTAWGSSKWVAKSCRTLIQNRVYLGEARHGEFTMPDAHPALTDQVTWRRANQAGPRPANKVRAAPSPIQGLVRCGSCRHAMNTTGIERPNGSRYRRWTCIGRSAAGECPQPASISTAVPIEDYVVGVVMTRIREASAREQHAVGNAQALEEARAALRQAEAAVAVFRDDPRVIEALGPDGFADGLAIRTGRVADARRDLNVLLDEQGEAGSLAGVEDVWATMDLQERQALLRSVVQAVFIKPGRSRHTPLGPDNVQLTWRTDPVELPRTRDVAVLAPLRFGDPAPRPSPVQDLG